MSSLKNARVWLVEVAHKNIPSALLSQLKIQHNPSRPTFSEIFIYFCICYGSLTNFETMVGLFLMVASDAMRFAKSELQLVDTLGHVYILVPSAHFIIPTSRGPSPRIGYKQGTDFFWPWKATPMTDY